MSKIIKTIDIVGLGALGVMYADFFTKKLGKEKVRVLADEARIERYKGEQVTFNGEVCDFQYCDAKKEDRPSELMLFAVKYGALETAMEENAHLVGAILVANAEGVDLSEKDLTDWVSVIDGLDPDGEPSMRQDSKAGRKTEVALFAGTICELGRKHDIATPVNEQFLKRFA